MRSRTVGVFVRTVPRLLYLRSVLRTGAGALVWVPQQCLLALGTLLVDIERWSKAWATGILSSPLTGICKIIRSAMVSCRRALSAPDRICRKPLSATRFIHHTRITAASSMSAHHRFWFSPPWSLSGKRRLFFGANILSVPIGTRQMIGDRPRTVWTVSGSPDAASSTILAVKHRHNN